jgi:hypothetical protein
MTASAEDTVAPTFTVDRVTSTDSAMRLLESCLNGKFHHVPWQPCQTDIKKGYVFISGENASGVKEWEDGLTWQAVISSEAF